MDAAAWGLVGTLVGALSSIGTTWLTSRNAHSLHVATKDAEQIERSNNFQRQTLLDLQEALHDALRLTTQAHIRDREAHQEGADWGRNQLGESIDESLRLAFRRVAILIERVAHDELRTQIKSLMSLANAVLLARGEQEARERIALCYGAATEAMEAVGTVLRGHY
jgi:hypothetical protein